MIKRNARGCKIEISGLKVGGDAELLNRVRVEDVKDVVKCVGKHLAAFSEGVLASVVAAVLMK